MYTVVVSEEERTLRFENRLNEVFRHCRIGKVTRKMQILGGKMVLPKGCFQDPFKPTTRGWI